MTIARVIKEHIAIVQGAGGPKAMIAGHRVRVTDIVAWHEKMGLSIDEILTDYVPTLTLADIYAALAYYWDHRDEIESELSAERAWIEQQRGTSTSLVDQLLVNKHGAAGQVPA